MKKILASAVILAAFPLVTFAQVGSFQSMFGNIIVFIDRVLIPFLFGIAFLFFVINVVRYFVIGAGNPTAQDSAKALALYGVAAFVFLVIFWGIVNMLNSSIGLSNQPVQIDYVSEARNITTPPTPGTTPLTENYDLDLSVDDIAAAETEMTSTDSPAGCISFSIEGICLDPAPSDTQINLLSDEFRGSVTRTTIDGHELVLGPVTHTSNSMSFELTNPTTGVTIRFTQTAINTESGQDDIMIRMETVRRIGDPEDTPIRWVAATLTYNETTNQMDVFMVSNTTTYEQTFNGTTYMNNQGQMVMQLVDRHGRETTWTENTWLTNFMAGEP